MDHHRRSLLTFVFALVLCVQHIAADLPPELKACQQSKADFSKCIVGEAYKAVKLFKNGYKKFGLLSLDPLRISKIQLLQGNGPVAIDLTFTDMDIHNLSNLEILEGTTDWKTLTAKVHVNKVKLNSKYSVKGKVLTLPITGNGPSEIIFDDINIGVKITFKTINKKGKKYLEADTMSVDLKPKKTHIQLDNLFNGDKKLSDSMNVFINENSQLLVEELTPVIDKAISGALRVVTNRIFANIPADQIIAK